MLLPGIAPMWRKLALLLVVCLAATASAQDAASAPAAPARGLDEIPFLEIPVKIADTRVDLGLFEGDNVNEAVEKFGRENSLNADDLATVKAEGHQAPLLSTAEAVTKNIQQSKQSKEPFFEFPVLDDGEVVPLRLFEGDNLMDAVTTIPQRQSIPEDLVPVLFEQVRAKIFPNATSSPDAAAAPTAASPEDPNAPVFSIPITVFGKEESLMLFRGDVLGEKVKVAATHGLDEETERKVLEAVAERIRSTQESVAAAEANRAAKADAAAADPPAEPKAPIYEISFSTAWPQGVPAAPVRGRRAGERGHRLCRHTKLIPPTFPSSSSRYPADASGRGAEGADVGADVGGGAEKRRRNTRRGGRGS